MVYSGAAQIQKTIWRSVDRQFLLQLFALVTPLFFQVVMDKVIVHHGLSTLHVLALGFLVVMVFEALLGGIRTYLFAHTSNRVDVELGSALYRHLLGLPLAYFQARAVGQSVARVRELDTIRNFITGSALTVVIDLSFTFIFFGGDAVLQRFFNAGGVGNSAAVRRIDVLGGAGVARTLG